MWVRWEKHCEELAVLRQKRDHVPTGVEQRNVLLPLETTDRCLHDPTQGILWESMLQQSNLNYKVIPGKVFSVGPSQSTRHLESHCYHQLKH